MKNIYFKIGCSIFFVSTCGFFSYFHFQSDSAVHEKVEIAEKINSLDESLIVSSENTANPVNSAESQLQSATLNEGYVLISPSELAAVDSWLTKKGYFPKSDVDVYSSYSDDSLKEMAKNGDLIALNVLSTRMVALGNEKEATFYMNLSVIHGSTAALDNLTVYTSPRAPYDTTEQERRPAVIETLAVIDVIAKRGDQALSRVSHNSFLRSYERVYGSAIQLTEEESQVVRERSQMMYDMFQQIRLEKGLGDFDNIEPEGVKNFFGMQ